MNNFDAAAPEDLPIDFRPSAEQVEALVFLRTHPAGQALTEFIKQYADALTFRDLAMTETSEQMFVVKGQVKATAGFLTLLTMEVEQLRRMIPDARHSESISGNDQRGVDFEAHPI